MSERAHTANRMPHPPAWKRGREEIYLERSSDPLRALSAHLQNAREEERTRIAREIHDELGQSLTALKMDLSWLAKRLPADQQSLLERTRTISDLVDRMIQSIWRITAELRPAILDELGLRAAIEWQAQEFQNRTAIRCRFLPGKEITDLDQDRSIAVFRIFQEALTNVARHAAATRVRIALALRNSALALKIQDNGRGIAQRDVLSSRSLGLMGMRERAHLFGGTLNIWGSPDKGTSVVLNIPIEKVLLSRKERPSDFGKD